MPKNLPSWITQHLSWITQKPEQGRLLATRTRAREMRSNHKLYGPHDGGKDHIDPAMHTWTDFWFIPNSSDEISCSKIRKPYNPNFFVKHAPGT